jgi:nucleoside-diphosphate-sugar epimerase
MIRKPVILILGACGQIGTDLTVKLRQLYGQANVIASDRYPNDPGIGNYLQIDVLDHAKLERVIDECGVTQVYLLTAMLSASGEKDVRAAWQLNMNSLLSVLNIAKDKGLERIFWPSSIAVFGPGSPKHRCPQETNTQPATLYGISKRTGEYWCNYYFEKFCVDVRSMRFPGLISYKAPAGGGITDYAVEIFHEAIANGNYSCFLEESTVLPMLYMDDAVRAIIELMSAPADKLKIRTSYNVAGISFAPCDIAAQVRHHVPGFQISYSPDYRQAIASGWPASIDDLEARRDWGWKPGYSLAQLTADMFLNLNYSKIGSAEHLQEYPDFQIEDVAVI